MILTGGPIHAEQALRWGLVDEIVPPDSVVSAEIHLAEDIAASTAHRSGQ